MIGTSPQNYVNYNQEWLDTVGISVLDTNYLQGQLKGFIHGRFCALIQSGLGWGPSAPVDASLVQTGTVPSSARSILVDAARLATGEQLQVRFNGTLGMVFLLNGGLLAISWI